MSWLRNSSIGASLGKLRGITSPSKDFDSSACKDSFKKHWQQIEEIIQRTESSDKCDHQDDILAVVSNLDHMVTLLIVELRANQSSNPCLEHVLSENLLHCLYDWSLHCGKYVNTLRIEQLKLYEVLISNSHTQLLVHEAFHRPLLKLLTSCSDATSQDDSSLQELEKRLVVLLNQLCVSLVHHKELLELFFQSDNSETAEFTIFSLLIPFIHKDGAIGQQARDALLYCMSLSKQNEPVAHFIAHHSNVCPVLATGLSGLYSLLPSVLTIDSLDWYRLTSEDINDIKELTLFMNSLEFCNAVMQVAHPVVSTRLMHYLYQGFLVPVMGTSLLQSTDPELVASTAYYELFIRTLTEPGLIFSFVRLIFKEIYDGQRLIDCIIQRINHSHHLSLVSLSLLKTLVDLNCEDVMLELVFKYLQPGNHVMASQRSRFTSNETLNKSAEKFFLLSPVIDRSDNLEESSYGDYFQYLMDAKSTITSCAVATSVWKNRYDVVSLIENGENNVSGMHDNETSHDHSLLSADDISSGYDSFIKSGDGISEFGSGPQSYSPTNSDISGETKNHIGVYTTVPSIGPFLETLLSKLENMLQNNLFVNLQLTGLISRLASFPQPLLRSFLLDYSFVFQPTIKSLFQIVGLLKQRIEQSMKGYATSDLKNIILEWESLLIERELCFVNVKKVSYSSLPSTGETFDRNDSKRRSFSASLSAVFRRNTSPNPQLQSTATGYKFIVNNSDIKRIVLCAIVLTEWMRELAALCLEHSVYSENTDFKKLFDISQFNKIES